MKKIKFDNVHKETKKPGFLPKLREIVGKYLIVSSLALGLTLSSPAIKADTAKPKPAESAEVKVAQNTQNTKKILRFPKQEVLDALETAKKYEIRIPDMTCTAEDINDPGYRVFYSKYGQNFTLVIENGGGVYLLDGIVRPRSMLYIEEAAVAASPGFWLCSNEDEAPGYKRISVFEVPYKKIVNGQEVQRSLIVIASLYATHLIAKDDSDGKWKEVGIYDNDGMIENYKTDKPIVGISLEKDEKTGEDLIIIVVVDKNLTRGVTMQFWSSDNFTGAVDFTIY